MCLEGMFVAPRRVVSFGTEDLRETKEHAGREFDVEHEILKSVEKRYGTSQLQRLVVDQHSTLSEQRSLSDPRALTVRRCQL